MKLFLSLLLASLASPSPSTASSFSDSLTNELYSGEDNECSSSTGVSMAMSLVYPAAISDTRTEFEQVFGFDSQTELYWQDTTNNLTSRMTGDCYNRLGTGECFGTNPRLEIANRFYVDDEVTLNASYAELLGEEMIQQIDLAGPNAATVINGWVNESTNGLIDSIVEQGQTDEWTAVAINSIYLKALWSNQFNVENTNSDLFLASSTTSTQAHFMNQKENFPYSHSIPGLPGYQVLQHFFTGDYNTGANQLSMILVLPPPDDTTAMATSEAVLNAIPQLERTQVALALPKFRFETTYEDSLQQALQSMGVQAVFDDQRLDNLCIEEDACNHYIDVILQKTFIEVNEFGLEAAAVTAIGMGATSMPPPQATLFLANRPFQFFVHDGLTNTVLFEGYIVNPGIVQGSVAPLEGSHNDVDFWKNNFGVTASMPQFDDNEGMPEGVSGNNNNNNNGNDNANDETEETPDDTNTEPETSDGSTSVTDPTNTQGGTTIDDETTTEPPTTTESGSQDPDSTAQDQPFSSAVKVSISTGSVVVLAMVGLWI